MKQGDVVTELCFSRGESNADALLTIAIPTFNRPQHLEASLRSVSLLIQNNHDVSVVVVDNTQNNEVLKLNLDVLKSSEIARIKYFVNQSNVGMFGNWNKCIELCNSEYVTILNDDDRLLPNFVNEWRQAREQAKLFVPRARIISPKTTLALSVIKDLSILAKRITLGVEKYPCIPISKALRGNTIHASLGVVFSKEKALGIGGFSYAAGSGADIFFTHKYADQYGIIYCHRYLAEYFWQDNASLQEGVAVEGALQEYRLRRFFIRERLKDNSPKYRAARVLSLLHLRSRMDDLKNSNPSWIVDLRGLNKVVKKVPSLHKRVINFLWCGF